MLQKFRFQEDTMRPDYREQQSHPSTFPDVRPEISLQPMSEINLKDKPRVRPEVVTEVAPETRPKKQYK